MPCWERFEQQDDAYKAAVLGPDTVRIGVEAAVGFGWDRYIGERGAFIGMQGFGTSAPAADLYEQVTTINIGYLDGEHPFPDRTHLSVLFATFQLELFDLIVRWVDFAKAEIDTWPTTEGLGMTARTEAILENLDIPHQLDRLIIANIV